jgi:hypothetical protein
MEEEYIFSGYCRTVDSSRMVTVETDGESVTDVACCYGNCPYESSCSIAEKIRKLSSR